MIPPGGEGEIQVTLRPKGTHTQISKNIVVISNDPEQPSFTLTMKGSLLVDMIVQPASLMLSDLPPGEPGTQTFSLLQTEGSTAPQPRHAPPSTSHAGVSPSRPAQNASPPAPSQPTQASSMQKGRAGSSAMHPGSSCPSTSQGSSPVVLPVESSPTVVSAEVVVPVELSDSSSIGSPVVPPLGMHTVAGGTITQPWLSAVQRLQYGRLP
ncbi:MAG: hypothetical protein KDK70_12720 [Myxococcales bacterium]|nr:hypothetical protein [Myxococcales bacterium]